MAKPACQHCASPLTDPSAPPGFCCTGCAAVYALLTQQGLDRFYALRQGPAAPVSLPARPADTAWLEPLMAQAASRAGKSLVTLDVDVQGIRCSACVWLLGQMFDRQQGSAGVLVNPAVGRLTLRYAPGTDVAAYLQQIERLGYRAGPPGSSPAVTTDRLLVRLGICAALTVNSMMFTAAHYFGMGPEDADAFGLMRALNALMAVGVVVVGGSEFITKAWAGLRHGHVGFDVPVALGILLSLGGSMWMAALDAASFGYFDSVATFTTLMLVGRWLQERVLEQNRRQLLATAGMEGLHARRVGTHGLDVVPAQQLDTGDVVLLPRDAMLAVDGVLADAHGQFSLDWINGEPEPRAFSAGDDVPAGAFNAAASPVRVKLTRPYGASSLLPLLARPLGGVDTEGEGPALLARISRLYTPVVLVAAALGALAWWWVEPMRALGVAVAVLVVTCPCALGLAIPLAWQRVAAQLRTQGIFVRHARMFDRVPAVRRVVFDKTGTLTLGTLAVAQPDALEQWPAALRNTVFTLAASSAHPRSVALHKALAAMGARFDTALAVTETPGMGLEADTPTGVVRMGAPSWVGSTAEADAGSSVGISLNGTVVAKVGLTEVARHDAGAELAALRAMGLEVAVLSGDGPARVDALLRQLGLADVHAVGNQNPQDKASWLQARGAGSDTLFVGDGVNDHAAFAASLLCGTPAVDNGVLARAADFYFTRPGVSAVRTVLVSAHRLVTLTRRIAAVALAYNAVAIAACLAGVVTPLAAAVAMPVSSLAFLAWAVQGTRSARASLSLSEASSMMPLAGEVPA